VTVGQGGAQQNRAMGGQGRAGPAIGGRRTGIGAKRCLGELAAAGAIIKRKGVARMPKLRHRGGAEQQDAMRHAGVAQG
jgi:hypothetical protein